MRLKEHELEHLLALARLDLDPRERQRLGRELQRIVSFVSQLSRCERFSVTPAVSVPRAEDWLRSDRPEPGLGCDELLERSPEPGVLRVPSPLEKQS